MRKRLAKLPSPAMAVAFVALLAALTGTAVALPGSNTVTSGDIVNGQVKTQDIRNSTVRGRDVRNNTLTGSDISESSLGTVPRATSAGTANTANSAGSANTASFAGAAAAAGSINGVTIIPIESQGDAVIFSAAGLTLTQDCTNDTVDATTSVDNSEIRAFVSDSDSGNPSDDTSTEGDTFGTGSTIDVLGGQGDNDQQVNIEYSAGNLSGKVSASFQVDEINEDVSSECGATGHALVSG